jgi:benzoate 4-monooxygenase
VVPPEGLLVDGHWLEGNTTVSVSTYTIHRDPKYFHDPDQFLPERWLEPGAEELQRVFLAFQQGGRACIGRNIAYLEMQLILTTLVRRYEFELAADEKWQLKTFESIMGHTGELPIKLRKRDLTV